MQAASLPPPIAAPTPPIEPTGIWATGSMRYVCAIYRRTRIANSNGRGEPGGGVWHIITVGQKYLHTATRNFSQPSPVGRILLPSQVTIEFGYFPPRVNLQDQDLLVDTTPGGQLAGLAYRVLGPVTAYDGVPLPEAAHVTVELRQLPKAPKDLP